MAFEFCIVLYCSNYHYSWVKTDMGRGAAASVDMEDAPVTLEDSVAGLTKSVSHPKTDLTSAH
jgi:hypothetical protein